MLCDAKRRILDMLAGWEDNLDSLARNYPDHADKYYFEAATVHALWERAGDVCEYGDRHAVECFLLEHVLPLVLEGK